MIFIGRKIIRKMSRHILSYGFLIIELAVGILFFTYGMNFYFSGLSRENRLEKEVGADTFYLDIYSLGDSSENIKSDVTYDDYINITKLTSAKVKFFVSYDLAVENSKENIQLRVVYSDINAEKDTAFYGAGSKQIFNNKPDRVISSLPVEIGKDRFAVDYESEKKSYTIKKQNYDLQDKILFRGLLEEDLKLENCIVLPLQDYQHMSKNYLHQSVLMIRPQKGQDIDAELQKICSYLLQQNGENYQYEFKNVMTEYKKTKNSYLQISQYIGKVSVIMLLVLVIGYRGVMNVFLERRKRELAICMAVGARRWQLLLEYIGEVALICFMGISIGLIIGDVLIKHSSSAAFPVRTQAFTIVMCIGIAFIIISSVIVSFIRFLFREQPLCGMRNDKL